MKNINEIIDIILFLLFLKSNVYFILTASQLKLDIFRVLSCHMWLVAMALGSAERNQILDFTRESKESRCHTVNWLQSHHSIPAPQCSSQNSHTTCTQSPSPNTLSN